MNQIVSDYHYGNEAEQYSFYRLPKILFTDERYKKLTDSAKILYGLMIDRMGLSLKNNWLDDNNRVFIYFSLENIMETVGCAKEKAVKLLKELDVGNGIALIERKRHGQSKPTKIHLKKFIETKNNIDVQTSDGDEIQNELKSEIQQVQKTEFNEFENQTSRKFANRTS